MAKITFNDKGHIIPYGARDTQIWDLDINEIKAVVNENADLLTGLEGGYQGRLMIADTPTIDGYYQAGESGTFANAGGLVVDLSLGITFINVSATQTVFTKTVIPVTLIPTGSISSGNTFAVKGGDIYKAVLNTWSAAAFASGVRVSHLGKYWKSNAITLSTDVPSVSAKWVEELTSYAKSGGLIASGNLDAVSGNEVFIKTLQKSTFSEYSKQILNKNTCELGAVIFTNGSNSNSANWVRTAYLPISENTYYTGNGFSANNAGIAAFAFYGTSNVWISSVALNGNESITALSPPDAVWMRLTLANVADIGLTPTDNIIVNNFMLNEGQYNREYDSYDTEYVKSLSVKEDYPEYFYSLTPYTGTYAGTLVTHDIAEIYNHLGNGYYTQHLLQYQKLEYADYVSGDFEGGQVVRYAGAKLFKYVDGLMVDQSLLLIGTVESEFVVENTGWSGGYHGNEDLSKVYFIVNGEIINPLGTVSEFGAIKIMECDSFSYIQKSDLKKRSDKSIMANRSKLNSFVNGGYIVTTKLKWKQILTAIWAYAGLVAFRKNIGDRVISDTATIYTPIGNSLYLIDNALDVNKLLYSHSTNDVSGTVKNIISGVKNDTAFVRLWDRVSDTKYYRQTADFTTAVDELFETTTTVEIKHK